MLFIFKNLFYALIYIFIVIFPLPKYSYTVFNFDFDLYKTIILFSVFIGVFLHQLKRIIKIIRGFSIWLRYKDHRYYKEAKYFYFILLSIISNVLVAFFIKQSLIGIVVSLIINGIILIVMDIIDYKKEIEELGINSYLRYFFYQLIGINLLGSNTSNILFCKKSNLNNEESFNLYSYVLLSNIGMSMFYDIDIILNLNSIIIFIIGIMFSYLFTILFHYLYSINKLKIVGFISIVLSIMLGFKMIL